MTQIVASNVGSTATLIGDPQEHIMIGSSAGLTFADFANYDGLACIFILAAFIVLFYFIYGRKMSASQTAMDTIMKLGEQSVIPDDKPAA